jgi:hypothetical protein
MSEENTNTESKEEVVVSEAEQRALNLGWLPEEDWKAKSENEGKRWRTADEFLERGELISQIMGAKSETKELRQAILALKQHHEKVFESSYQRAMLDLKAARKEALADNDHVLADDINERIQGLAETYQREKQETFPAMSPAPAVNPAYVQWADANPWYDTASPAYDEDMHLFADSVAMKYMNDPKTEKNPEKLYQFISQKVKQTFPNKFTNTRRESPNMVDGDGGQHTPARKQSSKFELSPEEEKVAAMFEKTKTMTRAQYIEELKKVR